MMQTGFAEQEGFKLQKRDGGNVWERADLGGCSEINKGVQERDIWAPKGRGREGETN